MGLSLHSADPATVYLPTHYVCNNRPVFDNMCPYLLWKASGSELVWKSILQKPIMLDGAGRRHAEQAIWQYAHQQRLSSAAKDHLLAELACRLGIDYSALCRRRLFHEAGFSSHGESSSTLAREQSCCWQDTQS
jgi:hypothetical protein